MDWLIVWALWPVHTVFRTLIKITVRIPPGIHKILGPENTVNKGNPLSREHLKIPDGTENLPVGVSVIGGDRHSMWNPLSHASQNKRLSWNRTHHMKSTVTVRRTKYCLKIPKAKERLKFSGSFHSSKTFRVFLTTNYF